MKRIPNDDPQSITHCLQAAPLQFIVQRAHRIAEFSKLLERYLPSELIPHCQVMNIQDQSLILQVDNAMWNTRIRYLTPTLIDLFSQFGITDIKCHTRP